VRRLFAAADIDFDQWKALTAVLLKLDFRTSSLGSHPGNRVIGARGLITQLVLYTLAGLGMAFFLGFASDLFAAGMVAMTATMFLTGTTVLLDHNSAIASPSDYTILGFRPVTSRTYLAVRLTNVLVYTTAVTTTLAWLPVAALFVRYGAIMGVTGILAFYACSTSTVLAILTGYAWMLRVVGADAVKRALSYVQLAMSILIYGGYFLMSHLMTRSLAASLTFAKTSWLLLFPATWFVAYLELAAGKTGPMEVIPALASVLAFGGMASGLSSRLSLDYSERLGAMLTAGRRKKGAVPLLTAKGVRPLFRTGEARGVAVLVRRQFQNDQRFRMGVLSILPLTLLYVATGVSDGGVRDPFDPTAAHGPSLLTFAVMMFPSMLKTHLTRSEGFRASWIFFACPVDRMQIIRASKDVLVAFFVIPYLTFLTVVYTYFTGNFQHSLVHIALLGCLSHLALQVALFIDPALPFSRPPAQKGQNTTSLFVFTLAIFIINAALHSFLASLYASRSATGAAFALLLLASVGVDRLTRVRVRRETGSLEFEG
jgi:hypothetical protein